MIDNTNNKEYWENYVSYWKDKVEAANNPEQAKDKTLSDLILKKYLKKLDLVNEDIFLDFGCGFCRIYPYYQEIVKTELNNYYGIDIANLPLELAEMKYPVLKDNKRLSTYDGIHIPYKQEFFDKIVCFGVFDACKQEEILKELLRVLKVNGELLLTGKNNLYHKNDKEAYIAEINAEKKGHPNYFTDVKKMIMLLMESGYTIKENYYFERRGDFQNDKYCTVVPEIFYEWALIIKKNDSTHMLGNSSFSNKFSCTYKLFQEE